MISLLIIIFLLIIVLFCFGKKKEKFRSNTLIYPEVQKYYENSYKFGAYGRKKRNYLHFGKFADFLPLVSHYLL